MGCAAPLLPGGNTFYELIERCPGNLEQTGVETNFMYENETVSASPQAGSFDSHHPADHNKLLQRRIIHFN
jgi:hypothetical protein